ncbi:MAG: hypothetical protein KDK25_09835 [Leptospiraceae bacterium]|nr:hypothetical protein [Leptospiraceae bacterium]
MRIRRRKAGRLLLALRDFLDAIVQMTQSVLPIVFLTLLIGLLIAVVFLGVALARRRMDARHNALPGVLADVQDLLPDLRGMHIGSQLYVMGSLDGRKVGFKYVQTAGSAGRPQPEKRNMALLIRMKIRETEHDPLYLSVFSDDAKPDDGEGWTRMEPGFFLGRLSGVSQGDQEAKYRSLSPVTRAALQSLARSSGGHVTICPDWEINLIGRDAALRLLEQDGVALTQLELQSQCAGEDRDSVLRHLRHMEKVVQILEKELPR